MADNVEQMINKFLSNRIWALQRFDFLHIGPDCNGSRSCSFSDAFCDLHHIEEHRFPRRSLSVYMKELFSPAYDILQKHKSESDLETKAFCDLANFLYDIESHSKKISNAFEKSKAESSKETALSMTIAEHLLTPLATGYTYIIDSRAHGKDQLRSCKCGCNRPILFGATGIGHHEVWHGFTDIIVKEINAVHATKVVSIFNILRNEESSLLESDSDEESQNLSSGIGECIAEVKLKINRQIESQAVAQTIVFALAQKQKYPDTHTFIPNILISDSKFFILMYEPDKDILMWSGKFPLWDILSPTDLNVSAIITLWMVIHYKLFCCGGEIFTNPNDIKAGFFEHIHPEKKKFYEDLHLCVGNFQTATMELGFTDRGHNMSRYDYVPVQTDLKRQRTK